MGGSAFSVCVPGGLVNSRKDVIGIIGNENDYMTLPLSRTRERRRWEAVHSRTLVEMGRSPPTTAGTERTGTLGGRSIELDMVRNTKWLGKPRKSASRPTSSYQAWSVKPNPVRGWGRC